MCVCVYMYVGVYVCTCRWAVLQIDRPVCSSDPYSPVQAVDALRVAAVARGAEWLSSQARGTASRGTASIVIWGFSKNKGLCLGVLVIRILVYWGLY